MLVSVYMLHFGHVTVSRGLRFGIIRKPPFIALDAVPKPGLPNVVLQDTGTEVHIVLNFEEVDSFAIRFLPPGWKVDLHDPDGIATGDRKRICAALDDDDTGNQAGIQVMPSGAP